MDERTEFNAAWDALLARLPAPDREMVETTLAGAEVNLSVVYMLAAAVIGALGGWSAHGWMS